MELKHVPEWQTFKSVKEMDEHVRSFLLKRKAALSEATLHILKFIWRHSVKHPGVSFAKNETIAKGTGYSIRTIIRAINRLITEKLMERVRLSVRTESRGRTFYLFSRRKIFF